MKKLNAFLVSVLSAAALNAAVIEQVIVRQQWPWSTDVKVEYKLKDVTSPVDIAVKAYNGDVELPIPEAAITGARYGVSDVVGTFVIDPVKAFGTEKVALANFKVKLTVADSDPVTTEVIYKVINLDEDPVTVTDIRRADFYNGAIDSQYAAYTTDFESMHKNNRKPSFDVFIWTGITNGDLYRTSKIALRKIPAAGQSYKMGEYEAPDTPPESSNKRDVSFTKNYWMGVFPITQAQLKHFLPDYEPYETNVLYGATRAASKVSFQLARSTGSKEWPDGNHSDVGKSSFIGLLQKATGNTRFDLPTEAQWEFAARAGSPYRFPSWFPDAQMTGEAWWYYKGWFNQRGDTRDFDRNCDLSTYGAYPPGWYLPNAWGLYDVMGNVWEWCLDRRSTDPNKRASGEDPRGSDEADNRRYRYLRGGGFGFNIYDVGSAMTQDWGWGTAYFGFRLCLHEED